MHVGQMLHELQINEIPTRGTPIMDLLDGAQQCSHDSCQCPAKINLAAEPYCLEHFIVRCYESLELLDPRVRGRREELGKLNEMRQVVEECSNRALLVSLRCETLTNYDRSRLLDILLWASDLQFLMAISPRDFDLLTAFRKDSEVVASFDSSAAPPAKTRLQNKGLQNS